MALDPLSSIGTRRAAEGALESTVPIMVAGGAWYLAYRLFAGASAGRAATQVELAVVLGATVGLLAWAVGRQFYLLGRRKPGTVAFWGTAFGMGGIAGLGPVVRLGFANLCTDKLGGTLVAIVDLVDPDVTRNACQIRAVPANDYLQGTLILPIWDGSLTPQLWILMLAMALFGSVGMRMFKLRRTQVGPKMDGLLRLAPSSGSAGSGKPAPVQAELVACKNPTLWGEPCAQVYGKEKEWLPGEWCIRCQQSFTPADRVLRFTVVTLFTAELDVLNGLERQDTLSWDYGAPMDEDPRISGQERWVVLGDIELPDVLTVSQALAFVHERLGAWAGSKDDRVKYAATLAKERASRLCAWIWFGRYVSTLTFARPTTAVSFASGPSRLRDLIPDTGRELMLQLDIGLLPLEVRTAFRQTLANGTRILQNSKRDVWVPVGPLGQQKKGKGVWVDRIEGEGLRTWLSTARIPPAEVAGVPLPLPYRKYVPSNLEGTVVHSEQGRPVANIIVVVTNEARGTRYEATTDGQGRFRVKRVSNGVCTVMIGPRTPLWSEGTIEIAEAATTTARFLVTQEAGRNRGPDPAPGPIGIEGLRLEGGQGPEAGSSQGVTSGAPALQGDLPEGAVIDLVRRPLDPDTEEPIMVPTPGESVAEWDWLEWEQIELLRRQCLVQVVLPGGAS